MNNKIQVYWIGIVMIVTLFSSIFAINWLNKDYYNVRINIETQKLKGQHYHDSVQHNMDSLFIQQLMDSCYIVNRRTHGIEKYINK